MFYTLSRLFWPSARFLGFFGLREAWRPLSGQKIPRNGPKAKRVWTKCKTFFCPWSYKIWSVLSVKCNFFILGISLLREKDKFPHKKNSLGLKKFFSLLPESDKNAPGKKLSPYIKKTKNTFKRRGVLATPTYLIQVTAHKKNVTECNQRGTTWNQNIHWYPPFGWTP